MWLVIFSSLLLFWAPTVRFALLIARRPLLLACLDARSAALDGPNMKNRVQHSPY